jgi:NAD(P)H-hydrate epimerase
MAELEARAYQEGSNERDFMENAGRGIGEAASEFIQKNSLSKKVWLLCGKGNNAGDAFVAGRYLLEKGYIVIAVQPDHLDNCSHLCQENGRRFLSNQGKLTGQVECFGREGIILDGIFGTGFKGQVKEPYSSLIEQANRSGLPILAIDIPSGLNGTTGEIE